MALPRYRPCAGTPQLLLLALLSARAAWAQWPTGSGSGSGSGAEGHAPCTGHGSAHNGQCRCHNAIPTQENPEGWTGEQCEVRIRYASRDGDTWDDMDGQLAGNEMLCYTVNADISSGEWDYLAVRLSRTSVTGDPDLYGLFYGGQGTLGSRVPTSGTTGYDFSETSSGSHPTVVDVVARDDYARKLEANVHWNAVYLCVYAWNEPANFTMTARVSKCPSGFTAAGAPTECSTPLGLSAGSPEHRGTCTDEGKCECTAAHRAPDTGEVYDGLGFDDCTATVHVVPGQPGNRRWEMDEQVAPNEWDFYSFEVGPDDYQVDITLTSLDDRSGANATTGFYDQRSQAYLYLKREAPPGSSYTQYDLRPEFDYNHRDVSTISLVNGTSGFRRGTWYAGVHGTGTGLANYSLSVQRFLCPSGCSGRGACSYDGDSQRHRCVCLQGYFKDDCSAQQTQLPFDTTTEVDMKNREYEYYVLNGIGTEAAHRNVELAIEVSYNDVQSASSYFYPVHPEVLLLQGGANGYPSREAYTYRKVLEKENTTYTVNVCASQLTEGQWQVALYNPVRSRSIAFNVTAYEKVYCPNNCHADEGHGVCNKDGSCTCNGFWALPDCGISADPSVYGCKPGQFKGEERQMTEPGTSGTGMCMHPCKCVDAACAFDEDACEEFTCRQPARRKGDEDLCVVDTCSADEVFVDKDGVYSCVRRCECPPDNGACAMSGQCDANTFTCHPPYEKASSGEMACVERGCDAGAFTAFKNGSVGECVCSTGRVEDRGVKCAYQSGTPGSSKLAASKGGGGSGGLSGAAAFFLCFFFLLGGGTVAFLARHWLEAALARVRGRTTPYQSFADMGNL